MMTSQVVAKKVAEVTIFHYDERWHLQIESADGECRWQTKPNGNPGVLLNKALQWANDRGLDLVFVRADITKQVPREEEWNELPKHSRCR